MSSEMVKEIRERSKLRRALLAKQFGTSDVNKLDALMSTYKEKLDKIRAIREKQPFWSPDLKSKLLKQSKSKDSDEESEKADTSYQKPTQSANPHNDYNQHYVDTGERPQNFIRDTGLAHRFEEYPKLRELIRLKDDLIHRTNTPPMYQQCDLEEFNFNTLTTKFDVILIEPPLEEYQRTQGASFDKVWSWDMIERLPIGELADRRSFIWMWVGAGEGLDAGRKCLKSWGFRRCEDICWIKTNFKSIGVAPHMESTGIMHRTKEHCLMGIKGTVKRSTDGDFIHANVDIDLIMEEEKPRGSIQKPVEIFHMIEHFCLGRRRLHLFGRDDTVRAGWLTLGSQLTSSNYDPSQFAAYFTQDPGTTTGCSEDIERLRPKSPPPKSGAPRGRGTWGAPRGASGPPRGVSGPPRGGPGPTRGVRGGLPSRGVRR